MLTCPACGEAYESGPDEPWRCRCGTALELADRPLPDGTSPAFSSLDTRRGLWAFAEFLPVARHVSLGEGFTPLVEVPEWDVSVKLEYCSPTGSFKDRGAATTLSRAVGLGVDRLVEDSSGNAGLAIAAYAARAEIEAEIYVPGDAKPGKRRAIEGTGARVVEVDGSREDVTRACVERVEDGDAWYASHAWNPAFLWGTATFALEIAAQRDWTAPDAVVLPLGHGTLFLGAARGFRALHDAGWIDATPRLLGAQAAGYAPIADALHGPSGGTNVLADGVRIRRPARRDELFAAIESSDGDVIAIGEGETSEALGDLRQAGFGIEPTSAIALAAVRRYRDRGDLALDTDVVLPLTGRAI